MLPGCVIAEKLRKIDPVPAATEGADPALEGAMGAVAGVTTAAGGPAPTGPATGATAKKSVANATAATPYRYCMPTHAVYTFPAPTARISLNVICT